ncbi:hypothetical protein [Methylobacterium brachiatum]|uniref:hypothetical protein n=1 Tax=Methylobacterium brachiatum TaxID=269660 RepID=UPI0013CE4E06|nr:hypothetical protein [Methylobacterium brachiatum]
MKFTDIPTKFPIPFGNNAASGTIRMVPQASQTATDIGQASLTDGFPVATGQPIAGGGKPPSMQDFNGILYQITAWSRWQNAGGLVPYDQSFSNSVGGYPSGAILASATVGLIWLNLVDNNTTNPDGASPRGWVGIITTATIGNYAPIFPPSSATLYVRPDGSDTGATNNGASNDAAHAFFTPEAAIKYAAAKYAGGSSTITIQLGVAATYQAPSAGLYAPASSIILRGDPANNGAYVISGTGPQIGGGGSVVGVVAGRINFNGITIQSTGGSTYNNHTLGVVTGASVNLSNVFFAAQASGSAGAHILSGTASNVVINAGCSMAGSIAYGLNSIPGGNIVIGGVVTMNSAPNFTQTFANALSGVIQAASGAGFIGSATGTRYYSAANGIINTNGGGANFFPGSVAGSTALGGQYL